MSDMNIHAVAGDKVRCVTITDGTNQDEAIAKEFLEVGKVYTVSGTVIHGWRTDVYLSEFPGTPFNTILFEDA